MDREQVRALFHEIFDLDPEAQKERLAGATPELRSAVIELLDGAAAKSNSGMFDDGKGNSVRQRLLAVAENSGAEVPKVIGKFRIERKLGEGGMGVVYAARAIDGTETIALKLIRPGLSSPKLHSRFRQEMRILKRLRHPGITCFHDAGELIVESTSGTTTCPYLVMELVEGKSLLAFAKHKDLNDRERVELLSRVADAVGYAHEHGVVHRDLKPGNILIADSGEDPIGQPKVLDFGVARALHSDAPTMTHTLTGAMVGTLPYMSPEQVQGSDAKLDERSDVYSLGVLAFELLAGRLPYAIRELPILEAARVIRESEPSSLSSVATRHRGILEVIVAKALEKDPARRYANAALFAADLRAFLAGEAVIARRPSKVRQARRFVRRHKLLVSTVGSSFLALLIGLAFAIQYAAEAERARKTATANAEVASLSAARGQLAAALSALDLGAIEDAESCLDLVPREHRSWEWDYLYAQLDQSLARVSLGESRGRVKLAFAADGSLRVCARISGKSPIFALWTLDAHTLDPKQGESFEASDAWMASDGSHVISSDHENRLTYRDFEDPEGYELGVEAGITDEMVVGAMGRALRSDGVNLWLKKAAGSECLIAPINRSIALAISKDGKRASLTNLQGELEIWQLDPVPTLILELPNHDIHQAHFSQDGSHVLLIGAGSHIILLELSGDPSETRTVHRVLAIPGIARPDRACISLDGSQVAISDASGTIRIWSWESGHLLRTLSGHRARVRTLSFSPDGERLASLSNNNELLLWATGTGSGSIGGDLPGANELSLAGSRIALMSPGSLSVHDLEMGMELKRTHLEGRRFDGAALLPSGEGLVVFHRPGRSPERPGRVEIRDGRTHELIADITGDNILVGRVSFAFSPDGSVLAAQDEKNGLFLWRTVDWKLVDHVPEFSAKGSRGAISFSPQGKYLACKLGSREFVVVQVSDLSQVQQCQGHTGVITSLQFSPVGLEVVSTSRDHTARIWSPLTGECRAVLSGHTSTVFRSAYFPDGRRLATASNDRTIRIWDPAAGAQMLVLRSQQSRISDLAFDADGQFLISSGGATRIWSTRTLADQFGIERKGK